MSEGELKKRIGKLVKTWCMHEREENGEFIQTFHDAYREPNKDDFIKWLDEARKDIFASFHYVHNGVPEQTPMILPDGITLLMDIRNAEFKLTELTRRLLKWFGDAEVK